ncbi:DUF4157 domain-containing protein [Magnetospirillum sp. 64-120]|uniref:eCIS core domain-containing protein n=1 Tax=Magnetospirillum sp. 64-120 TaxID=1895778 RepID=UPI000A5B365B|nr:DUF4157 domain-containing protein [Magnetospirillum sp. 64-120]
MSGKIHRPPPIAGQPVQPKTGASPQHVRHLPPPVQYGAAGHRPAGAIQGFFPGGLMRIPGPGGALQAKTTGNTIALPAGFVLPNRGQPLAQGLLQRMEAVFRTDLSSVRVQVGPEAPSIGALAFTVGDRLFFAPGQFAPETPRGLHLLGHELAHVIQQRSGRVRAPQGNGFSIVLDPALEAEADRMGRLAATGNPGTMVGPPNAAGGPGGQRQIQAMRRSSRGDHSRFSSQQLQDFMGSDDDSDDEDFDIASCAQEPFDLDEYGSSMLRKALKFNNQAKTWMKADTPMRKGVYICHICGQKITKGQSVDMDHLPPWKARIAQIDGSDIDVEEIDLDGLYNMRGSVFAHSSCNRGHSGEGNWAQMWNSVEEWYDSGGGPCIDKSRY